MLFDVVGFVYAWQLAGCVHIAGHWLAASLLGVPACVAIPWQRCVPLWGWGWNLTQPHSAMMCSYEDAMLRQASPTVRALIGFAGPYAQLIFVVVVGTCVFPGVASLCGGSATFALMMCIWQLAYFVWYAIHFHSDEHSDFRLFVAPTQ